MTTKRIILFLFIVFVGLYSCMYAQNKNQAYIKYIEQYKNLAIEQMRKHHIPASITLAQGLLESGAGKSRLAVEANNHFGIKCGSSWEGPYIRHDDDERAEKFRKYNNVKESYDDHSRFLKKQRYAYLFELDEKDYEGWAKGLKKCGYATNPNYAFSLIDIIERYDLAQYDQTKKSSKKNKSKNTSSQPQENNITGLRKVYLNNNNYYIVVRSGDCLKDIARETGVSVRRLLKFNELPKDHVPTVGDILYLRKKQRKAHKMFKNKVHVVKANESMYSISQRYGMRLEYLYKLNNLPADYTIRPGDTIRVR